MRVSVPVPVVIILIAQKRGPMGPMGPIGPMGKGQFHRSRKSASFEFLANVGIVAIFGPLNWQLADLK